LGFEIWILFGIWDLFFGFWILDFGFVFWILFEILDLFFGFYLGFGIWDLFFGFQEEFMTDFEPTIIAFVCNWCTYTAADLAGTSRLSYPKNIRLVRVMCTGMVDSQYIIKALLEGADGVLVSGCHPGDCHYINGNYKARRRIKLLREILTQFGFEKERVRLTWIGASDGIQFAENMHKLVNQIKELGPNEAKMKMVI